MFILGCIALLFQAFCLVLQIALYNSNPSTITFLGVIWCMINPLFVMWMMWKRLKDEQ